jgi:hypothetical protein
MNRQEALARRLAWHLFVVTTSIVVGTTAAAASDPRVLVDLTNALRAASTTPSETPRPAPAGSALEDAALLGVVITGSSRRALIQRRATYDFLTLGESRDGYRLVDVQETHATLEGQGGDRFTLRLSAGGTVRGRRSDAASPAPGDFSQAVVPDDISWKDRMRVKEERAAQQDERDAQEKSRPLLQQGLEPKP